MKSNFFNLYVSFLLIDNTHKRITLLPDKLNEESKVVLKNLLSRRNLLEELNSKEANDILIRASPKDVRSMDTELISSQDRYVNDRNYNLICIFSQSLQIQSLSRRESQGSTSLGNSNSNGGIQT